jgi:hypothetical protein
MNIKILFIFFIYYNIVIVQEENKTNYSKFIEDERNGYDEENKTNYSKFIEDERNDYDTMENQLGNIDNIDSIIESTDVLNIIKETHQKQQKLKPLFFLKFICGAGFFIFFTNIFFLKKDNKEISKKKKPFKKNINKNQKFFIKSLQDYYITSFKNNVNKINFDDLKLMVKTAITLNICVQEKIPEKKMSIIVKLLIFYQSFIKYNISDNFSIKNIQNIIYKILTVENNNSLYLCILKNFLITYTIFLKADLVEKKDREKIKDILEYLINFDNNKEPFLSEFLLIFFSYYKSVANINSFFFQKTQDSIFLKKNIAKMIKVFHQIKEHSNNRQFLDTLISFFNMSLSTVNEYFSKNDNIKNINLFKTYKIKITEDIVDFLRKNNNKDELLIALQGVFNMYESFSNKQVLEKRSIKTIRYVISVLFKNSDNLILIESLKLLFLMFQTIAQNNLLENSHISILADMFDVLIYHKKNEKLLIKLKEPLELFKSFNSQGILEKNHINLISDIFHIRSKE